MELIPRRNNSIDDKLNNLHVTFENSQRIATNNLDNWNEIDSAFALNSLEIKENNNEEENDNNRQQIVQAPFHFNNLLLWAQFTNTGVSATRDFATFMRAACGTPIIIDTLQQAQRRETIIFNAYREIDEKIKTAQQINGDVKIDYPAIEYNTWKKPVIIGAGTFLAMGVSYYWWQSMSDATIKNILVEILAPGAAFLVKNTPKEAIINTLKKGLFEAMKPNN